MIDPCQPLGHAVIVSVFSLERELEETLGGRCQDLSWMPAETEISSDPLESRIASTDQTHPKVIVGSSRPRCAEYCSNEVIVEEWGPHGDLRLLQCENRVVVPGSLPEDGKRKRVLSKELGVCRLRLANVGEKLRTE